eukprot:1218578-Rhodomonas_salina.2
MECQWLRGMRPVFHLLFLITQNSEHYSTPQVCPAFLAGAQVLAGRLTVERGLAAHLGDDPPPREPHHRARPHLRLRGPPCALPVLEACGVLSGGGGRAGAQERAAAGEQPAHGIAAGDRDGGVQGPEANLHRLRAARRLRRDRSAPPLLPPALLPR